MSSVTIDTDVGLLPALQKLFIIRLCAKILFSAFVSVSTSVFSIENFYYILHQQLLKPLGIHDALYYKFGSIEPEHLVLGRYLKINELNGTLPFFRRSWCYFFDQEPLNADSIDCCAISNGKKSMKILANSEKSLLKKHILKEHQYTDWYYFFHGFAALDWFRDAEFFDQDIDWDVPYMSMNRLHAGDRSYRMNLVARLAEQKILEQGRVSLHLAHTEYGSWKQELDDPETKLSKHAQDLIVKHLTQPLRIDVEQSSGDISAALGHREFELWKSALWHIVTETVFYHDKLHLTEKIFKPIVAQRPFLLAAAPGNLAYLKSYGFQTFDRWIDESYDDIQDSDQRLQAIVEQTQRLCSMSTNDLQQMHKEMQPVLEHNFNHMYGDFKKKIVNELVDNFETSIRLWNNGRFDDNIVPLQNVDLVSVKKKLLI
jgi:hypothetical protein